MNNSQEVYQLEYHSDIWNDTVIGKEGSYEECENAYDELSCNIKCSATITRVN